jgi:hypothetical protein
LVDILDNPTIVQSKVQPLIEKEIKMKRLKFSLGIATLILSSQALLIAQFHGDRDRRYDRRHDRRDDRHDDRGDRRERISAIISDLEQQSNDFKKSLNRALDRSRLDGTRREDQLNKNARKMEKALNYLRDSWNEDHDMQRSKNNAALAINAAGNIDRTLSRHALRGHVQREWEVLRDGLDRLADIFDLSRVEWQRWDRDRRRP